MLCQFEISILTSPFSVPYVLDTFHNLILEQVSLGVDTVPDDYKHSMEKIHIKIDDEEHEGDHSELDA